MLVEFSQLRSLKACLTAGCAVVALGIASMAPETAFADEHGGSGGSGGKQMQHGGSGGGQGQGGHGEGGKLRGGGVGKGLGGIFRDITGMDDQDRPDSDPVESAEEVDGDGGRPAAAGAPPEDKGNKPEVPGSSKKGDLFGDLWVILRDDNGLPILTNEGWVQPLGEDGLPIALDPEGHPENEDETIEVELGRLNVGRAPSQVLDRRASELIAVLSDAEVISTDAAGRLVLTTTDGEEKTIDSPLDNLAIYVALLTSGSIPGLTPDDLAGTEFDFLVDGVYDDRDLDASTALLAAATDKDGEFTSDEIAYINAFLGINTTTVGDVTYSVINYTTFSYDRYSTFGTATADVLIPDGDGGYDVELDYPIYELVFGERVDSDADGVIDNDVTVSGSLDAYTQAADDARLVIETIHNLAIPE